MTRNATGEGKLPKQALHALGVPGQVRIEFRITAFKPCIGDQRRAAVSGTDNGQHVQIAPVDDPVQVGVNEIEPGSRTPVPEQPGLDVLRASAEW